MRRNSSWLMWVLYSLIDIRHFLASTLVGTIGVFLPLTDAHAATTPPSSASTQTLAAAPTTASRNATVAGTSVIGAPAQPSGDTSIRPFKFHASDEALADLHRRIAATRWPSRELVTDASQGVQLATMRELARYWQSDYDWRKFEARRVRRCDSVITGPWVFREAHHSRLGSYSHRTRLDCADATPGLHAVCSARRRLG